MNNNYNNYNKEKSYNTERIIKNTYKNNNVIERNSYNFNNINSNNFVETENSPRLSDSMNMNTLESITIKKIDEEEEKRTMELEQEAKKLDDLENEKIKLAKEEKEIRERILEEIEKHEKKEKEEKKKRMKLRYVEGMKKKQEDEERLRQIKLKQEMKLKEINELKYKKQMEEQKLHELLEGKLNKQEIKTYRISIQNEDFQDIQQNKNPFNIAKDININEREFNNKNKKNDYTSRGIIKNYILNESKMNYNDKGDDNILQSKQNNFKNKEIFNNSGTKPYQLYSKYINDNKNYNLYNNKNEKNNINVIQSNYLPKENLYTISTIKNHSNQLTINSTKVNDKEINVNDYASFSPPMIPKKNNLSLSPNNNSGNKLTTELDQLISFSPIQNGEKNVHDFLNNNENNERSFNEGSPNSLYEKKAKKNIKRGTLKKIDNSFKSKYYERKNLKEKLINFDENHEIIKENNSTEKKYSFNELNQIQEITSKIRNEIDRRVDTIVNKQKNDYKNTNKENITSDQILYKAKSSSKINPLLKNKNNDNNYFNRNENNKFLNEKNETKSKDENKEKYSNFIKETNNELNQRNNNYIYENDNNNNKDRFLKQKSFMEDYTIPNEIKKENYIEVNKYDRTKKKEKKDNSQLNYGTASTNDSKYLNKNKSSTNIYKSKNEKIVKALNFRENLDTIDKIEEKNNFKIGNQRENYLNPMQKKNNYTELNEKLMNDQNNSKHLLYYKEIYSDDKN